MASDAVDTLSVTTLESLQSIWTNTPPPARPKTPADFDLYHAAKDIMRYQALVLFAVGFPANCLNIAVLLRKNMRSSSPSVYFLALAVFDSLALCSSLATTLARVYYPGMVSEWFCKALFFVQSFSEQSSTWSVVVMTSERLLVVLFPLKATRWCSVRNASIAVIAYSVLSVGFNLQYFWTVVRFRHLCVFNRAKYDAFLETWSHVSSTTTVYVPVLWVLVLNVVIIRQTWRASSRQQAMTTEVSSSGAGQPAASSRAAKQARQITTMLMTVSLTFLLLTTPYSVYLILYEVSREKLRTDPWLYSLLLFLSQVCSGLFLVNHSLNFFLYCLTGSRFRSELCHMLGCARSRKPTAGAVKYSAKTQTTSVTVDSRSQGNKSS